MSAVSKNGLEQLLLCEIVSSNQTMLEQALVVQQRMQTFAHMQAALLRQNMSPRRLSRMSENKHSALYLQKVQKRSILHEYHLEM
jgi:hypothetical protein